MNKKVVVVSLVLQMFIVQAAMAETTSTANGIPNECKVFQSAKLENCIAAHKASDDCASATDSNRIKCAKEKIGLKEEPAIEIKKCGLNEGMEKKACETTVKRKIINSVVFSFDDLAVKAKNSKKISPTKVKSFVAGIESSKVKFNAAKTYTERAKVLEKVRADWSKFVKANRGKITTKNNLDKALKDLKTTK